MKKKVLAVALAAALGVTSFGLSACSGSKKNANELWITYFSGGYGDEWVRQLGEKFEEETGIKVVAKADTLLIDATANMMRNGTDYDLLFCHDVPWEDFVQPGYIYNLDELYSSTVDEAGTTFEQRIWDDGVLASCRYPGADGQYHYYKVPWTIGTAGIAYNLTVMDRVDAQLAKKGIDRQWNRTAPKDYYELLQYCEDVVEAHIQQDPDEPTSSYVTPFTWSGKEEEWQWDYVVFDWWGQMAGPETMNVFKNFNQTELDGIMNPKNADKTVYDPAKAARENNGVGWKEFKQAYELWYDLVVGHKDWSYEKSTSLSKFDNENRFAYGYAAMTPAASWVEYEAREYLADSEQEICIMPTPTISNVKIGNDGKVLPKDATTGVKSTYDAIRAADGATEKVVDINGIKYNRVSFTSSFGDSVMIPVKAAGGKVADRTYALEFLKFMQKEENAQLFTKLSGGTVLPYKYKYEDSFKDASGVDHASAWQKSIFEIDRNSTKFNNYTQNLMMRGTSLRHTARMTAMWPENEYYYLKAYNGDVVYTGRSEKCDPDSLFTYIYKNIIQQRWSNYVSEL